MNSELGLMTALEDFTLYDNKNIGGSMPQEVCSLRELELNLLVVQCFRNGQGVECSEPDCCTRCRRGSN